MAKKISLIAGFILVLGIIVGLVYLQKTREEKNNDIEASSNPKIGLADYYWKKEVSYSDIEEKNIPEIIIAADKYISDKVGSEFFSTYIKYYPYQSKISRDGSVFYLSYIVTIPGKNIDFKTTTHPVEIPLTITKELSLVNREQILRLPDCGDIDRCLKYADRDKAISIVISDIQKKNYQVDEIMVDFDFYTLRWHLRYELSDQKLLRCGFRMGGMVSLYFDAFNDKIVKRQIDCNFPGI